MKPMNRIKFACFNYINHFIIIGSVLFGMFMLMPKEGKADAVPQSRVDDDDQIIIVGDREHAPFEYIDEDGTPSGFLVELVEHILDKKDLNYRIRLRNHAKALSSVQAGDADIILLAFNVNNNDSNLLVSRPLRRIHTVAVCNKDIPTITLNDLKNYKVVMLDKSYIIPDVDTYLPKENIVYVDNVLDAIRLVQDDKYDIALVPSTSASYYLANYNFNNLNMQELDLVGHSVRIGISKFRPDLQRIIDQGIEESIKDGSFDEIYEKWFTPAPTDKKYPYEVVYVLLIGGILFVAMIIIIFYTLIQTKRIRRFSSSETSKGQFYKNQTNMLLDAVPVGVAIYDGEGNLKYVNSTLATMFSIKDVKEYVRAGHSIYDNPLISERNKLRIRKSEDFDFMLTYTSDIDARYKYAFIPEEDTAYFECKIRHVKAPNQDFGNSIYFVLNDITGLQVARNNIENQTNCLNLALGAGNLRVWSCDIATSMIYKQFDYSSDSQPEMFAYRDFLKTIHPDDLSVFLSAWDNMLSLRSEEEEVTIRVVDENGVYSELTIKMKVMFESTGRRSQTMRILMVSKK